MLINFGRIGENLMTSNWPRPLPDNKVFIPLPTPCAMCRRYKKKHRSLVKKHKSKVMMCSTLESRNRAIRDEISELQTQIKNRKNMISMPPFVIPCELS